MKCIPYLAAPPIEISDAVHSNIWTHLSPARWDHVFSTRLMTHDTPLKIPQALKLAGHLLLLSGWAILLCAFALLQPSSARITFVSAGFVVELLGFGVVIYAHGFVKRGKP